MVLIFVSLNNENQSTKTSPKTTRNKRVNKQQYDLTFMYLSFLGTTTFDMTKAFLLISSEEASTKASSPFSLVHQAVMVMPDNDEQGGKIKSVK